MWVLPTYDMGCWMKFPVVGSMASDSPLFNIFSLFITHVLSENPCGVSLAAQALEL